MILGLISLTWANCKGEVPVLRVRFNGVVQIWNKDESHGAFLKLKIDIFSSLILFFDPRWKKGLESIKGASPYVTVAPSVSLKLTLCPLTRGQWSRDITPWNKNQCTNLFYTHLDVWSFISQLVSTKESISQEISKCHKSVKWTLKPVVWVSFFIMPPSDAAIWPVFIFPLPHWWLVCKNDNNTWNGNLDDLTFHIHRNVEDFISNTYIHSWKWSSMISELRSRNWMIALL